MRPRQQKNFSEIIENYYTDKGQYCGVELSSPVKTSLFSDVEAKIPYYATFITRNIKNHLATCTRDYPTIAKNPNIERTTEYRTINDKCVTISETLLGSLIGEIPFNPKAILQDMDESICSIQEAIRDVVESSPIDIRRELVDSIILSGGVTTIPGFQERLHQELIKTMPNLQDSIKVYADENRENSIWIGGNILATCESFQDMWILKQEYDEYGAGK